MLNKWQVYCKDEKTRKYIWLEEGDEPSVCPTDTGHSIDTTTMSIYEIKKNDLITIREENTPTGGNFRAETVSFDIEANSVGVHEVSWPIPINVLEMCFHPKEHEIGNLLDIKFGPDTVIGILTSDVEVGDEVIYVNESALSYLYKGYEVKLSDGVNEDDLGMVIDINFKDGTITTNVASSHSFSVATPTYIKQTIHLAKNFEISSAWKYAIGESKIGGNYIPENTTVRIVYDNKSAEAVRFVASIEYLY